MTWLRASIRTRLLRLLPLTATAAAAAAALGSTGCVVARPYEREVLSHKPMDGANERVENKFRQHWGESREGSSGGYATAGGGCGCN